MTTPEQTLWREVLLLTVQDAIAGSTEGTTVKAKIAATHAARAYLTKPNKDMAMVCTMADLDPVAVRQAMIKRIADTPSPEDLIGNSNKRRQAGGGKTLTHAGHTLTISEWSEQIGISTHLINQRFHKGWDMAQVLDPSKARGKPRG